MRFIWIMPKNKQVPHKSFVREIECMAKAESKKRPAGGEIQLDGAIEPWCSCCIVCARNKRDCGKILLSFSDVDPLADEV